ncbi:TetR/AcrR family transcriptional regulator [Microlunatus parietis]|uniref:AcrR family transcriptional regulator n=1 Tax=Microlunatus parietis TaxID=682979 RepID=A0A7Y9LDC9_9ACTN|nr:TetR/AcrR family transcriptional regulator [Microlunatus parietis]NYE73757.1 AcrR family transcriptional regulator [Microlunatus parietis]
MARPPATSREAIDEVALDLFLRNGYAAVTVADLVAAAGISRPTFFRYVTRREDLVLDQIAAFGARVADALDEQPGRGWRALGGALGDAIDAMSPDSPTGKAFRVIQQDADLRAKALGLTRTWRQQLTEALVRRGDYGGDPLRCEAAAAMAIGLAQMIWADPQRHPDPRAVFAQAAGLTDRSASRPTAR